MSSLPTTGNPRTAAPFDARLRQLRQRAQRLVLGTGLCWFLCGLIWLFVAAGLTDALLHIEDTGVRVLMTLVVLGLPAAALIQFVIRPLVRPTSDLDLALLVERSLPAVRGKLATAIEFLRPGAADADRAGLRARTLDTLTRSIGHIELESALDRRPFIQSATCALAATLVGLLFLTIAPQHSSTAVMRLLLPFSERPWPRTTQLMLVDEDLSPVDFGRYARHRAVVGEVLELYVADRNGDLPENTDVQYFDDDATTSRFELVRTSLRDAENRSQDVLAVRLFAAEGTTQFRFVGGDDHTMPWLRVEAGQPPAIDDLQITVFPPEYTGRSPETLADGRRDVSAVNGSRIRFRGSSTLPLSRAALRVQGEEPQAATLAADHRRFEVEWTISHTGYRAYWFELVDRDGFRNPQPERAELEGIADALPVVELEQPATHLQVGPDAVVPVSVHARDDIGLSSFLLHLQSAGSSEQDILRDLLHEPPAERHSAEETLEIAKLGFRPGQQFELWATATDEAPGRGKRVGQSARRTISVVSAEQKSLELKERLNRAVQNAKEILDQEAAIAERLQELAVQWDAAQSLPEADADRLQQFERNARLLAEELAGNSESVLNAVEQIEQAYRENRLTDDAAFQRSREFLEGIQELASDDLAESAADLTALRRWGAELQNDPASAESSAPLTDAARSQQAVVDSLAEIVERMGLWQDRQALTEELQDLVERQAELQSEVAREAEENLTKTLAELSPQEKSDLQRLAARQRNAAERTARLQERLKQAAETLSKESPFEAEPLTEAQRDLDSQPLSDQLNESAGLIAENNLGRAMSLQKQSLETLRKAAESIAGDASADPEKLVEHLQKAKEELEHLRKQQQQLSDAAAGTPSGEQAQQRAAQQRQLQQQAEQMRQRLQQLRLRRSANEVQAAEDAMRQAAEQLAAERSDNAGSAQAEAERRLQRAAENVENQLRQQQAQLDRERLEGMADRLRGLLERQRAAIDEAERLRNLRERQGNWTRAQLVSLRSLSETQQQLAEQTALLTPPNGAAGVVPWLLDQAATQMQEAVQRLSDRQLDELTLRRQQQAARLLELMLESLDTEPQTPPAEPPAPMPEPPPPGEQQDRPAADIAAQLRLLRTLQHELMQQTRWVSAQLATSEPDERQVYLSERARLAVQQQELVELLIELQQAAMPSTNEAPETDSGRETDE